MFAIVQFRCGLTHHVLELHRLDEFCVPLQIFLVHVIHNVVLPCGVNLIFVQTCPRVFRLYGFSLREAVDLCWTSYALVVSGIRIVSQLCSHRMRALFLASNFAFFSSFSSRDSLSPSSMVRFCRSIVDRLSSDAHIFSSTSFLVAFKE